MEHVEKDVRFKKQLVGTFVGSAILASTHSLAEFVKTSAGEASPIPTKEPAWLIAFFVGISVIALANMGWQNKRLATVLTWACVVGVGIKMYFLCQ